MVRCRDWGDKELRFEFPHTMSVTLELYNRIIKLTSWDGHEFL